MDLSRVSTKIGRSRSSQGVLSATALKKEQSEGTAEMKRGKDLRDQDPGLLAQDLEVRHAVRAATVTAVESTIAETEDLK